MTMTPLGDEQLTAMLNDLESDNVERKESWAGDAPKKGRQAVCAFANDLPNRSKPGVLFVGARDDGSPSNLDVTDQLLLTLADLKTDGRILPPPTIVVEPRTLTGARMAVVTAQNFGQPGVTDYRNPTIASVLKTLGFVQRFGFGISACSSMEIPRWTSKSSPRTCSSR